MRSLMLSVERAIETTLCTYEIMDNEKKKFMLEFFKKQRSYDCEDYNLMS